MSNSEPKVVDDSEKDELFYSELLDLMQATSDAAVLQSEELNESKAKPVSSRSTSSNEATIKPYFVVGGSLFTQRHAHKKESWLDTLDFNGSIRLAPTACFSIQPRYRQTLMGVLRRGSLFCPFTKQFFSLSSPHWQHLKLAGFAVDASMQNGRRVQLLYPRILYRLACQLQQTVPSFTDGSTYTEEIEASLLARGSCPATAIYQHLGWSPALARTLGVLLEEAPAKNFKEFHHATVGLIQQESNVMGSRRVPLLTEQLPLYPSTVHSPTPQQVSFFWHTHRSDFLAKQAPLPLVELGHVFVREATQMRRRVLQEEPKLPYQTNFPSKDIIIQKTNIENEEYATVMDLLSPVASSLEPSRVQLPGVPCGTRAAFFRVPFWGGRKVAGALLPASPMLSVCACLLRYFLHETRRANAPPPPPLQNNADFALFFCRIEHSTDYNSVLDLEACAIASEKDIDHYAEKAMGATFSRRVPLLSLGLEGAVGCSSTAGSVTPEPLAEKVRIVVIANAHMLSKRALGRLLDQWTRNGAAESALRTSAVETTGTRISDRAKWQLLMSVEPFTKCVRTHYAIPFGNVRVIFVGLSFASLPSSVRDGDSARPAPHSPLRLAIDPHPKESIFHLTEPLSAALLHASALTPRMNHQQRVLLLQDIVRCAQASLVGDQLKLTANFSKTLPCGRVLASQTTHLLSSERGSLLLYEGCEALLSAAMKSTTSEHLESVLATYPFLSHLKCRHDLLSAYEVQLRSGENGDAYVAPTVPLSSLSRAHVDLLLTSSRVEASNRVQHALEEHARIARAAALAQVTKRAATGPEKGLVFTQTYSSFMEPALLVGRWTPTFFLCAPLVADVTPLARYVLEELRRLCRCTHDATLLSLDVVTVDVYHVDYVIFPKARRCRLFGLRALHERRCTASRSASSDTKKPTTTYSHSTAVTIYIDPQVELSKLMQGILKRCASRALFFPMWTYNVGSSPLMRREAASATGATNEQQLPVSEQAGGFAFGSVDEGFAPCVPSIVERRLFSLAATQHPTVTVAIGCHLLLTSPIHCQSSTCAEQALVAVPAGSVVRVTSFISARALSGLVDDSVPESCRWHLTNIPTYAKAWTATFVEQQQTGQGRLLPIVECVQVPSDRQKVCSGQTPNEEEMQRRHYVLLPQPFLVGGYPSLHHYTLPLLHLPVLLLEGGNAEGARRVIRRRENISSLAQHKAKPISFCYSALELLHPYHSGPRSVAALLFCARERLQVLHFLLKEMAKGKEEDLLLFTEDIPFAPHGQSTYLREVDPGTREELERRAATPLLQVEEEQAQTPKNEFTCLSMTELSLFARYQWK